MKIIVNIKNYLRRRGERRERQERLAEKFKAAKRGGRGHRTLISWAVAEGYLPPPKIGEVPKCKVIRKGHFSSEPTQRRLQAVTLRRMPLWQLRDYLNGLA